MAKRARRREAGFTMIEILIVIAMLAILAAIAVPQFLGQSRKAKANSEVVAIFNDLRMRLEQFAQENGTYPPTIGEGTMHPAGLPTTSKVALLPTPATWDAIRFMPTGPTDVYCRYTWVTGTAGNNANLGTQGTTFGFTVPATDWWYLLARCNMDGDSATDSFYFTSSTDPTIQKINEGR
ncbi:MAG: type II secretion system protein [Deltaproteobacteria bacterium]|nr:type II secretion system protein [Deltaproteobacteria bacterium]MCW5806833.1 type II secretion system protein [Deltaproteobacteria bacterium]